MIPVALEKVSTERRHFKEEAKVRLLNLNFDLPVRGYQMSQWRGAMIHFAGREQNVFHNHTLDGGCIYRYPRIQYRAKGGLGGLLALNEGIDAVQQTLATRKWEVLWNGQARQLQLQHLHPSEYTCRMCTESHHYELHNWLPLNQENYQKWQKLDTLVERTQLLERILIANIFSFATSIQWWLPERIQIQILDIHRTKKVRIHHHDRLYLNLDFKANLQLPNGIGLGRAVSFGFGTIRRKRRRLKT